MLKTAFPFKGTDTVNSLVLGANFTPDDQTRQVITSVYFFFKCTSPYMFLSDPAS